MPVSAGLRGCREKWRPNGTTAPVKKDDPACSTSICMTMTLHQSCLGGHGWEADTVGRRTRSDGREADTVWRRTRSDGREADTVGSGHGWEADTVGRSGSGHGRKAEGREGAADWIYCWFVRGM